MARVLLIGTFETKRDELAYLSDALRRHGLAVEPVDVSLGAGGRVLSGPEKLARMAERAEAAAAHIAANCSDCSVALGVGGGTGGEIVLASLRRLPAVYPKVLITTMAFDPRAALADTAITLVPTLCDIEGLNPMLRRVFENTAAMVAGLRTAQPAEDGTARTIAVTTLGATGRGGAEVARLLREAAFEATVFHANGYGGAAFARFVAEGRIDGIIDLNVHELGRLRLAGAHVPMAGRFDTADVPKITLPGALNFLGLGEIDTLSEAHRASAPLPAFRLFHPCQTDRGRDGRPGRGAGRDAQQRTRARPCDPAHGRVSAMRTGPAAPSKTRACAPSPPRFWKPRPGRSPSNAYPITSTPPRPPKPRSPPFWKGCRMPDFPDLTDKMDALIASARRCFDLGLQTNAGGNLSVRLDAGDAIVIKPSGVGFAECTRDNLQVVALDGTILSSAPGLKPSKDLDFHRDLYRIRDDINAIVHCHSPWATGYASAGIEIPCLTVQTIEKIGRMPLIPLSANGGPQTEKRRSARFSRTQASARRFWPIMARSASARP